MTQLFSFQQKLYTYTPQAAASSMHIRESAISWNTHWKNADLRISQYCTQYYTMIHHTDLLLESSIRVTSPWVPSIG